MRRPQGRDLYAVGLTRVERTAVLACLEDPPDGLAERRGVLMHEHRDELHAFCPECRQRDVLGRILA